MKVRNSQKGFTLLELLVALAVGGVLLGGLVTAIFQTTRITMQSSTQITALEDIKNVIRRITTDVRMAATANRSDSLVLNWTSWYDNDPSSPTYQQLSPTYYQSEYTLLVEGKVQREYKEGNEPGVLTTVSTTIVGRYISDIEFSQDGDIITVVITSSPEGKTETAEQRTYQFYLQPKKDPVVQ